MIKRIDHIAIVVRSIADVLPLYAAGLGIHVAEIRDMPGEGVKIAFLSIGGGEIELVEPTDESTGVYRFLQNRGEGLHHICLEVDDIRAHLHQLDAAGVEVIDKEPRPGAYGLVAFIHPKAMRGVLIELVQKD